MKYFQPVRQNSFKGQPNYFAPSPALFSGPSRLKKAPQRLHDDLGVRGALPPCLLARLAVVCEAGGDIGRKGCAFSSVRPCRSDFPLSDNLGQRIEFQQAQRVDLANEYRVRRLQPLGDFGA